MIKANELMVGNWVKVLIGFGKVKTIDPDPEHFNGVVSNDDESVWERVMDKCNCDPIQLTPDILDKCPQLVKWEDGKVWEFIKDGNHFQYRENEVWLGGDEACISGHGFTYPCKYLHQLQNAFALTGEDLIYTL